MCGYYKQTDVMNVRIINYKQILTSSIKLCYFISVLSFIYIAAKTAFKNKKERTKGSICHQECCYKYPEQQHQQQIAAEIPLDSNAHLPPTIQSTQFYL
jgi:hypothetical protein